MTADIESYTQGSIFGPHASIGRYGWYLFMGHCIYQPDHYRRVELDIGQTLASADESVEFLLDAPEKRLIEQLGSVVRAAALEVDLPKQPTIRQKADLQTYLVEEVSTGGKDYAKRLNNFTREDPLLENATSPFSDDHIFQGVLSYRQCGRVATSFLRYASLEKLLPGYAPLSS